MKEAYNNGTIENVKTEFVAFMDDNSAAGLNREHLLYQLKSWVAANQKTNGDLTELVRFHVAEFPDSYNAWYALGYTLQNEGDLAGAKEGYTKCLELFPGFVHADRKLKLILLQEKWGMD